jgi:hypothetical protein
VLVLVLPEDGGKAGLRNIVLDDGQSPKTKQGYISVDVRFPPTDCRIRNDKCDGLIKNISP